MENQLQSVARGYPQQSQPKISYIPEKQLLYSPKSWRFGSDSILLFESGDFQLPFAVRWSGLNWSYGAHEITMRVPWQRSQCFWSKPSLFLRWSQQGPRKLEGIAGRKREPNWFMYRSLSFQCVHSFSIQCTHSSHQNVRDTTIAPKFPKLLKLTPSSL